MTGTIRIGSIRGIPLMISGSWLIVFILFLWVFAASYYPDRYEGWTSQAYFAAALTTVIFFFASIILHELGHATVAARYGIKTRSITLLPIGGVAEIEQEPQKPFADFAVAIAGPITSLLLGGLFFGLYFLLHPINVPLGGITAYLGYVNIFLGLFNLLPGYPMDGGRILRAIVWGATKSYSRGTRIAATVGTFVAYLFIFFGITLLFRGQIANGAILAFIGWFILSSANMSVQQLTLQRGLAGVPVEQAMSPAFPTVETAITIAQVVNDTFLAHNTRSAAVTHYGTFVGFLTLADIMRVPQEQWATTRSDAVMIPRARLSVASPTEPALTALQRMQESDFNQLPVIASDRMVGVLTRNDILRFLQLRESLHLPSVQDDSKPPELVEREPQ